MVEGWVVPENRALARRPQLLGLPLDYAALLIMAVLFLALTAHHVGAALYLLFVGWAWASWSPSMTPSPGSSWAGACGSRG